MTASVGVATLGAPCEGSRMLSRRGPTSALYAAKREGRNRVVADAA